MQSLWLCQWVEAFRSIFSTLDLAGGQWGGWKGVLKGQQNGSYVWRSSPLGLQLPTQVLGDAAMVSLGTTVPGIEADVSSARYYPLLHFDRSTLAFGTLSWSYLSLVFVSAVDKKETNMNKLLLETSFLIFSPDREKSKSQRYQNVHDLPNTLLSAGFEIS